MKHHPRGPVRGAGSREYRIDAAAMEVEVRVERRTEAVDENHGAQAGRGAAAGTVRTQGTLDGAQQDAHDHALQRRIVVQEIAQPLGYRKDHRFACLGFRFAASNCRSGNGGNT